MIQTIRERLKELEKNGNTVNVLADTAGNVLTLTGVKVKGVRENHVLFIKGSTNTAIPFNKILDVEY